MLESVIKMPFFVLYNLWTTPNKMNLYITFLFTALHECRPHASLVWPQLKSYTAKLDSLDCIFVATDRQTDRHIELPLTVPWSNDAR